MCNFEDKLGSTNFSYSFLFTKEFSRVWQCIIGATLHTQSDHLGQLLFRATLKVRLGSCLSLPKKGPSIKYPPTPHYCFNFLQRSRVYSNIHPINLVRKVFKCNMTQASLLHKKWCDTGTNNIRRLKSGARASIPACAMGEAERTVILWITAAFDFKTVFFCAWFAINNAPIIRMLTCTGGAPPLVARARACPVCPTLAMVLRHWSALCKILLKVVIM